MNTNQQKAAIADQQNKKNASGGELAQKQVAKPMTKAMQKVDEYRDQMNEGRKKIMAEDYSSVVYLYESNGLICAVGYRGRAKKQSFHYRFRSEERRLEYVQEWMTSQKETKQRRQPAERQLNVGDVLKASWGYEQTNVDYYLVTKLIGKNSVEIVEIGREIVPTGDMQGRCIPDKHNIIGEPMRKRVDGAAVRITSYITASKKGPRIVAGCEIFDADSFSSYH